MIETLEQILTAYDAWLNRQPLAAKTCLAYRLQAHLQRIEQFMIFDAVYEAQERL